MIDKDAWEFGNQNYTLHKKAIIHQVTTVQATTKNVLFPTC